MKALKNHRTENRILRTIILCSFLSLLFSSCATMKSFTSPRDYVNEGLKYYNDRNYKQAARYFEKAIELDPAYQPAHSWLGASYAYIGRKDESLREFKRVLEIDSSTKDALSAQKWIESLEKPISIFIMELEDSTNNRRFIRYNLGKVATKSLARNLRKIERYEVTVLQPQKMAGYFPSKLLDTKKLCSFVKEHGGQILIVGSVTKVEPRPWSSSSSDWYAHTEALVHLYNVRTGRLIKSIRGSTHWPWERLMSHGISKEDGIEKSFNYCFEVLVEEIKKYLP